MSDDNKVKLLKIQHALLEALAEKKIHAETEEKRHSIENELAICLLKYKELVTAIEHGIYRELQDKLTNLKTSQHNLEEELIMLEEIETFYNQLVEIQTRFKQTYALYSREPLILSDINGLNIDLYFQRKESIKAYLVNKKNIADNKKLLEKVSNELIVEEQKETRIDKKIMFLEEELIRRLLSSEGRLLINENNHETLKYTSIVSEYQSIGITIDKKGYSGKTLAELTATAKETKEKLAAATISYEVMPGIEKKKILDEIRLENIEASYQLVMAKLLSEIYTPSKNCEDAIQKRERIKDLLKYRKNYLESLGIKHGVDPFSRLLINEQLEELKQYENNSRVVARLRRELSNLNARIESLEAESIENSTILEESQHNLENSSYVDHIKPSFNDYTTDIIKPTEVRTLDNQVTNVKDVALDFNYKKCQEITQNVIRKVYEILTHPEVSAPRDTTPELIIEPKVSVPEVPQVSEPVEEIVLLEETTTSELPEHIPNDALIQEPEEELFLSADPFTDDNVLTTSNISTENTNSPVFEETPKNNVSPVVENSTDEELIMPDLFAESTESFEDIETNDIFSDITPFESPILFSEKVDTEEVTLEPSSQSITILQEIPESKPSDAFSNMELELEENKLSSGFTEFWSTDANVNNLTNTSLELDSSIKPQRKGK